MIVERASSAKEPASMVTYDKVVNLRKPRNHAGSYVFRRFSHKEPLKKILIFLNHPLLL